MAITSGVDSFIVATMIHVQEVLSADESSNLLKVALTSGVDSFIVATMIHVQEALSAATEGGYNKWSGLFHSGDHDPCPRSIICRLCCKVALTSGVDSFIVATMTHVRSIICR